MVVPPMLFVRVRAARGWNVRVASRTPKIHRAEIMEVIMEILQGTGWLAFLSLCSFFGCVEQFLEQEQRYDVLILHHIR